MTLFDIPADTRPSGPSITADEVPYFVEARNDVAAYLADAEQRIADGTRCRPLSDLDGHRACIAELDALLAPHGVTP